MTHDMAARWHQLAAPLPTDQIQWRQDGKPGARNGKFFARFVAYIDAQFAQARLDQIFPGEWTLTHELLPERGDEDGVAEVAMKAVLTIAGVVREGVGTGKDYKSAASDSFKRAAVRFGVAAELYDYDVNWVQVDSDSKYAKPVEDPSLAYERKQRKTGEPPRRQSPPIDRPSLREQVGAAFPDPYEGAAPVPTRTPSPAPPPAPAPAPPFVPKADRRCPICGSTDLLDKRATATGNQPLFTCKTKGCKGALFRRTAMPVTTPDDSNSFPDALRDEQDDLPF